MAKPIKVVNVSKIAVGDGYNSGGDPHFDFSATINGDRVTKDQIPAGSLVQGKLFTGEEVTILAISFVDDSIKNDPTRALWRGKAVKMSIDFARLLLDTRMAVATEKQAKSAYTDVKGKGYVPSKAGDPVAESTSAPATDVSDIF